MPRRWCRPPTPGRPGPSSRSAQSDAASGHDLPLRRARLPPVLAEGARADRALQQPPEGVVVAADALDRAADLAGDVDARAFGVGRRLAVAAAEADGGAQLRLDEGQLLTGAGG